MISRWGYDDDFEALYCRNSHVYDVLQGKRVLVTGATGLVGTCVTEFLLYLAEVKDIDIEVTALSSSNRNLKERFGGQASNGKLHVLAHDVRQALPRDGAFHLIIHAAGVANPARYVDEPVDVIDITLSGARNVLEYARRHGSRVAYISSVEVYGDLSQVVEEVTEQVFGSLDPYRTRCSYTESKRLAETLCQAYTSQYGVDARVIRLCKTYGPSNSPSDERVMAMILGRIASGQNIDLKSDGSRTFSFCYVTDAAAAILVALLKGASGEAYNVSDTNSVCSLKNIAQASAALAGVSAQMQPKSDAGISKDTVVNSAKLQNLGWSPLTDMQAGLRKQYECVLHLREPQA